MNENQKEHFHNIVQNWKQALADEGQRMAHDAQDEHVIAQPL